MPSFHNGAVEIAYLDEGEGEPILLVHGFASTKNVNWVYPTWVSELRKNGRRVIALDNRGHGDSSKLYDAEQYHIGTMAGDVAALMDDGLARAKPAAAAAFSDFRRSRDGPDRRRRSWRDGRKSAGGAVARGRDRSGRANVSRLRRSDPLRSPGAGGLSARLAAFD